MKSQNVLKTTSQMCFSLRHLAATLVLSKFIKQPLQAQPTGLFLTAASLPTEEAVVSPLFSIALEHQEHLYNCKDVKVARLLE